MPSSVRNLCANPLCEPDEGPESRLVRAVASEDRELLTDELDDRRGRQRHRALPAPLAIQKNGRGLMVRIRLAFHHELRLPCSMAARGLDPDARYVALFQPPFEARPHADHDPRAVRARDREEQSAGLRRSER